MNEKIIGCYHLVNDIRFNMITLSGFHCILNCLFFRFIVVRRVLLIMGLLYGYRAITMYVTILPRADNTYYCEPKLAEQGKEITFVTISERVFSILSGTELNLTLI